jgi:hypothetical protein
MQRISLREADGTATRRYSCVRVTLNDGRCFEEICDSVPPLDEHRLISKITDCFAVAGVALCGDHLYSQIVDLADSPMTALEAVIQTIRPLPDAGPTRTQ